MAPLAPSYVRYDARPGDMITMCGVNYRVVETRPNDILAQHSDEPIVRFTYEHLRDDEAYYATRCIPCLPPTGKPKI